MADEFTIEGLEEAIRRVESLAATLEAKEVEDVLLDGAKVIVQAAQGNVHVRSGKLKRAIKAKRGSRKYKSVAQVYAAVDFKVAPHAYLVEYGSIHAPAHPYFRPAVDQKMPEAQEKVEDGLKKLIEGGVG